MKHCLKSDWTPLLMDWFDTHKRDLPWRTESPRDPYKVWVSEIMLQQTRVEAVRSYYINWMEHFPDIPSLAAAEEDEVVRQWQGLGYYILSMAYGKRETAVDGNVLRVFARIYNIEENILSAKVKKEITELVKARQDVERPGDFNEALMDLGATVCIPGQPRCEACPLVSVCLAKKAGKEAEIPLRVTKKEVPVEPVTVFVVRLGQEEPVQRCFDKRRGKAEVPADAATLYLLHRRPSKGLLAGMWEFPNCVGEGEQGKNALTAELSVIGVRVVEVSGPVKQIRHVFSHKVWQMTVYEACAAGDVADRLVLPSGWRWVPVTELADYNLAGPHNRILGEMVQNEK